MTAESSSSWSSAISRTIFLVLSLYLTVAPAAAADEQEGFQLLVKRARLELTAQADEFAMRQNRDIVATQLAILESQFDRRNALMRARYIQSPFYSSLALGGIAATEMNSDLQASTNHFLEALARCEKIAQWTGEHSTSLGFLIDLVPQYPESEGLVLLTACEHTLSRWKMSDYEKTNPLLALAKATVKAAPDRAEKLLLDVALKSHHYSASTELLARFLYQQAPDRTITMAEQRYNRERYEPDASSFLRAVLLQLAETDFPDAFQRVKRMRAMDQERAAVGLATAMVVAKRKKEAGEVLAYLRLSTNVHPYTMQSLSTFGKPQTNEIRRTPKIPLVTHESIDDFLKDPTAGGLRSLVGKSLRFRDDRQARTFVQVALPLTDQILKEDLYHGAPRASALGFLMMCSAATGEFEVAAEMAGRRDFPEVLIAHLLNAAEHLNSVPPAIAAWPVRFRQPFTGIAIDQKR